MREGLWVLVTISGNYSYVPIMGNVTLFQLAASASVFGGYGFASVKNARLCRNAASAASLSSMCQS
jgi:hypothetical protein